MNFLTSFFLILCPILIQGNDHKLRRVKRVANGCETTPHSFTYQVGINTGYNNDDRIDCAGALISRSYVLTAAYCTKDVSSVYLYFGAHDLENGGYTRMISENIHTHNLYNSETLENDIALIQLPYPVELTDKINIIPLPLWGSMFDSYIDKVGTISGWGATSDRLPGTTGKLRSGVTKIINNVECSKHFGSWVRKSNICTDGKDGFGSICGGDGGAPLVVDGVLIGIASFMNKNGCDYQSPSVFTRINHYMLWISEQIRATSSFDNLVY